MSRIKEIARAELESLIADRERKEIFVSFRQRELDEAEIALKRVSEMIQEITTELAEGDK